MALNIGDKIPGILGTDQDGKEIKASDYSGQKLVLYFYPKDSTPGCTAEACSLRDNFSEFRKAGYNILGVSIDDQKSHKKFIEKQQLPFPLISDTNKKLVEEFGVWGEKTFMGRKFMGTFRTTFLIDESGIIEKIIGPKEIKTKEHGEQILKTIVK
ncbi:thioredoxin-dependent thiol peroxidase [Prevotella sp. 10(H)]|uniref:thioredoxin-dependent thiol peroxidase n=1 Tax=Prevotella sp. 10(H) TaxID=1158294 RepID=UPI0004A6D88C|nr:thioredoxin-dependent thiol peroxidase [Prevotella sp. 10(H)]